MVRKIVLRHLEGGSPLTCYRVDYWKGIDQRYAMIAASDIFDAEQRFRKIYPKVEAEDIIEIWEMED